VQEDRLWIADPAALNHVLQKTGRLYGGSRGAQERAALVAGRGIFWAQGDLPAIASPFLFLVCLTISQERYTNATGG